jgi:hypothetical protein
MATEDVQFTFYMAVRSRLINNGSKLNHCQIKSVSLIMLPTAEVYFCPEIILVCNKSRRWEFLAHILCFVLCRMYFVVVSWNAC